MSTPSYDFKLTEHKPTFFEKKYILCLFITLILSLVDGTMTIYLLELGAWEVNPFMRQALSLGHEVFFFSKYFLTAGGLLLLLINADKRILRGMLSLEEISASIILFYEGLIIYEITIYHIFK
jgi:hypothetical protein